MAWLVLLGCDGCRVLVTWPSHIVKEKAVSRLPFWSYPFPSPWRCACPLGLPSCLGWCGGSSWKAAGLQWHSSWGRKGPGTGIQDVYVVSSSLKCSTTTANPEHAFQMFFANLYISHLMFKTFAASQVCCEEAELDSGGRNSGWALAHPVRPCHSGSLRSLSSVPWLLLLGVWCLFFLVRRRRGRCWVWVLVSAQHPLTWGSA